MKVSTDKNGSVLLITIFVIGDNHKQSVDSRYFGFVPVSRVYGKVITFNKQSGKAPILP